MHEKDESKAAFAKLGEVDGGRRRGFTEQGSGPLIHPIPLFLDEDVSSGDKRETTCLERVLALSLPTRTLTMHHRFTCQQFAHLFVQKLCIQHLCVVGRVLDADDTTVKLI